MPSCRNNTKSHVLFVRLVTSLYSTITTAYATQNFFDEEDDWNWGWLNFLWDWLACNRPHNRDLTLGLIKS